MKHQIEEMRLCQCNRALPAEGLQQMQAMGENGCLRWIRKPCSLVYACLNHHSYHQTASLNHIYLTAQDSHLSTLVIAKLGND
jgi:hypothetical protein